MVIRVAGLACVSLLSRGAPAAARPKRRRREGGGTGAAAAWFSEAARLHGSGAPFEEVLASLEAALAIDPQHAAAHYNRGAILDLLGATPEDVLACLSRAIAIDPLNANAHSNRGGTLLRTHAWQAASDSYKAAMVLQASPAHPFALLCITCTCKVSIARPVGHVLQPNDARHHVGLLDALQTGGDWPERAGGPHRHHMAQCSLARLQLPSNHPPTHRLPCAGPPWSRSCLEPSSSRAPSSRLGRSRRSTRSPRSGQSCMRARPHCPLWRPRVYVSARAARRARAL